jgi:hypothetical protein
MDTEWFAVDATGAVAVFDTGEDGALPMAAATGLGPEPGTVDGTMLCAVLLARRIERGEFLQTAEELELAVEHEGPPKRMLIALREPPPGYRDVPDPEVLLRQSLPKAGFDILREDEPWIGLSREPLSTAQMRALLKRGLVVALVDQDELSDIVDLRDPGDDKDLFRYGRDHGDEPGVYLRLASPVRPIGLDEVPAEARAELGKLRFEVGFADTERLHLADHMRDEDASYYGDWTLRGFGPTDSVGRSEPGTPAQRGRRAGAVVLLVTAIVAILWALSRG